MGVIALIDLDSIRSVIVKGLKEELKIPIIRANQTGPAPAYPYLSYTITSLISDKNGTWGEYDDGMHRKPGTMTFSLTVQSDKADEAMALCIKARDWLDHTGNVYLKDNKIIVQSVGAVNNRDNLITIEYENRFGFDFVLWFLNETGNLSESNGEIREVDYSSTINI